TVLALGRWLAHRVDESLHTDALAQDAPGLQAPLEMAAGIMAISISRVHRHYVVWFRPERVQTITWAGEPVKLAAAPDGRLHPRRS
ncbi:hypothetical protein ACXWOO_10575, partial [Streptococcus pyogenes]